jgi:predicted deacetylase
MKRLEATFILLLFSLLPTLAQQNKTVYVTVRVDDVFMRESSLKPQEIDGFIDVCEKHGARVMLAVIPHRLLEVQNQDGAMAATLKRVVGRGHMVSMHGFKHLCSLCGSTGHEFDCAAQKTLIPYEQELEELSQGKELLEKITGKKVITYVSPGSDDQLNPQTKEILKKLGFSWVTDTLVRVPTMDNEISRAPDVGEFTWDLSDSTYEGSMKIAVSDFERAVQRANYFGFALHDHFTRGAFRNGIVLRWTDEFLSRIERTPGVRIRYVTLDDIDISWFSSVAR